MHRSNYRYLDIDRYHVSQQDRLLVDANVWIAYLDPFPVISQREQSYINFIERVIRMNEVSGSKSPKIVVPDMVISEVFNRIIRKAWELYKSDHPQVDRFKDYRSEDDCYRRIKVLQDDFKSAMDSVIEPIKCFNAVDMLMSVPANTDFNDYCYYEYSVANGYKIVTDDGDFLYQGVDIITANRKLLKIS